MADTLRIPVIVIQTHGLRESDLIATLLSRERGKIKAVARGARRSKKRFMGGLDLVECGIAELKEPSENKSLYQLNGISERQDWTTIRTDFAKLHLASYSVEISNAFCEEEDHEAGKLFDDLFLCLKRIHSIDSTIECYLAVHYYNLCLLEHSGLGATGADIASRSEITDWWIKMLEKRKPLAPPADESSQKVLLKEAFTSLANFTEHNAEKRLLSKNEFLFSNL